MMSRARASAIFLSLGIWLALGVAPASAGNVIASPGPIKVTITSGAVTVGTLQFALSEATLNGTIDKDGNVLIPQGPQGDIGFKPIQKQLNGITATIRFQATHPASGQLDPSTGQFALRLRVRAKIETQGANVGDSCFIGSTSQPIDINKLSTQFSGGVAYKQTTGTATLTNTNYSVPAAQGCGSLTGNVNDSVGVPAAAGKNKIKLAVKIVPPPQSGGSKIAGGISNHEQGSGLPPDTVLADPSTAGDGRIDFSGGGSNGGSLSTINGMGGSSGNTLSGSQLPIATLAKLTGTAHYDDGIAEVYIGCDGVADSSCAGEVSLALASSNRRIGRSEYLVSAGETSVTDVTAKLSRRSLRTLRRYKKIRIWETFKPDDGKRVRLKRWLRL